MFLIRGPPGTGKTDVIAEITAQLVTRGKKVLIASENHKAVDNAFQRLPEIPSLRRLRLFGGYAAKKNEKNPYSDKFLTRNLYLDIAKGLENEMKKTSSSKAYADSLDRKIADLRARVNEVDDLKKEADSILQNMDRISLEIKKLNDKIS
jgi:Cdc6-like AAA superfamily ATPase